MQELSTEIFYLFITTLFCGVLWIPYVTERFLRLGIKETCGYKDNTVNISEWAVRAKLAHFNLVENLILFGIFLFLIFENISFPFKGISLIIINSLIIGLVYTLVVYYSNLSGTLNKFLMNVLSKLRF